MNFICSQCGTLYRAAPDIWKCRACGEPLELEHRLPFRADAIQRDDHTLWRYDAMIARDGAAESVSLGEGMTPLVAATWGGRPVHFKLEYLAPTGSFKDRGTTVLVSQLKAWGVARAADDSSGNAGASFAAYAARAGIAAEVYTPAYASPAKLAQIEVFGARLNRIEGVREKATEALEAALAGGLVYASHAWSPFTYEGTKTVAYEVWEQLGGRAPDAFVSPVGQGSLFLGAYRGFCDLLASGAIAQLPRMIGVQSMACAPIVEAVRLGLPRRAPIVKQASVAEGISLAQPIRDRDVLRAIRISGGDAVAVSDEQTLQARNELARAGFFVEPTSAVVGAALKQLRLEGVVVVALSGSGLKSPPA